MNSKDEAIIKESNDISIMLESFLLDLFFGDSPMDARIEIQHTNISEVFIPGYKEHASNLHNLLYLYCFENIKQIRIIESIINENVVIMNDNQTQSIDYYKIFLHLDNECEINFFRDEIALDEFVKRYRLLCVIDALVGIGNTLWTLDNMKDFILIVDKKAANILVKESHLITRSLSAFYIIKMHTELYKTEQDNSVLREKITSNMRAYSKEMRELRKQYLHNSIKVRYGIRMSQIDANFYKKEAQQSKNIINQDKTQRKEWSKDGGENKEYFSDLMYVIESFLQKNSCKNLGEFKVLFGAHYNEKNVCSAGKRKYYIGSTDGIFYREQLSSKNKYEYKEVPHSSLEKIFEDAQKNVGQAPQKKKKKI